MAKKGKKIYIRKDLVANKELSELDFVLQDEFNYDYEKDEFIIIDSIRNPKLRNSYYVDNTIMNINDLEKVIKAFKKKDATHMAILHHPDHIGYEFSGFKVEQADDELINAYENEILKKLELDKQYQSLYKELKKIDTEIRNLKI